MAVDRIQNASDFVLDIQELQKAEFAFAEAEHYVVYSFVSNSYVPKGLNLNTTRPFDPLADISVEVSHKEDSAINFWSAAKGLRLVQTQYGDVTVQYQDTQGLLSINGSEMPIISKFLRSFDIRPEKADRMTAALIDYIDTDTQAIFRGAERQTYRLHNQPPPTNSPLRSYEELESVLRWPDVFQGNNREEFIRQTTLDPFSGSVKDNFATIELLKRLGLSNRELLTNAKEDELQASYSSQIPSNRARFTFYYQVGNENLIERIIEIERDANGVLRPFKIYRIAQFKIKKNDVDEFSDIESLDTCCLVPN